MGDNTPMGCETCQHPLARFQCDGKTEWFHMRQGAGHPPKPVPLATLNVTEHTCDFCCNNPAVWVYSTERKLHVEQSVIEGTGKKSRTNLFREDQKRQGPLSGRRLTTYVEEEKGRVAANVDFKDAWPVWSACEECAALIERRSCSRLVTRAKRAAEERGAVILRKDALSLYEPFFANLLPGRVHIGEWEFPATI